MASAKRNFWQLKNKDINNIYRNFINKMQQMQFASLVKKQKTENKTRHTEKNRFCIKNLTRLLRRFCK